MQQKTALEIEDHTTGALAHHGKTCPPDAPAPCPRALTTGTHTDPAPIPQDTDELWDAYKTELGRDYLPDVPAALRYLRQPRLGGDVLLDCLESLADTADSDMPAGMREFLMETFLELRQLSAVVGRLGRRLEDLVNAQVRADLLAHRAEVEPPTRTPTR